MKNLDEVIRKSKKNDSTNSNFVDRVMKEIHSIEDKKHKKSWIHWAPVMIGSAAVVALVVFFGIHNINKPSNSLDDSSLKSSLNKAKTISPSSSTNSPTSSPTEPSGTNVADLNTDLNTIDQGLNKDSQDISDTNNAVNDQQQEIYVPTK